MRTGRAVPMSSASLVLVTVPFVVVFLVSIPMTTSMPVIITLIIMMFIPRDIFIVVPVILHEVDRSPTRMVLRTMLVPMLLMPRRDVQIDRLH